MASTRITMRSILKHQAVFRSHWIKIVFLTVAAAILLVSCGLYFLTIKTANPNINQSHTSKPKLTETAQAVKPLTLSDFGSIISKEKASVVKVTGYGCGGELLGTGFLVAPDLVVTNAHVVAGINTPQVTDDNGSYDATTVLFDPKLDFAVLRVSGTNDKPLVLNRTSSYAVNWVGSHNGEHDVILGYPGGNDFQASLAVIADEYDADVTDIYGGTTSSRDIYKVTANVIPGNSGGPLVQQNGQVAGIVFGIDPDESESGLVLPTTDFYSDIQHATLYTSVSTQECADLSAR